MKLLDQIRESVRAVMRQLAQILNKATGGRLTPTMVTLFGFAMHFPIAILIARGYFIYAGILLAFFGLFDALDGALAKVQNTQSKFGMFLDSVTDKMKEAILYIAVGYFFVWSSQPWLAVWAVAACGAGLLVSYINAWGEVVTKDLPNESHQTNKTFRLGIMTFDVRMFVLIVGLILNQLGPAIIIITIFAWITALQRVNLIIKRLRQHA